VGLQRTSFGNPDQCGLPLGKRPTALFQETDLHSRSEQGPQSDLKGLFKAAATMASVRPGPFQEFYESSLAKGIRPTMVRLSLARKIAAIPLPQPRLARNQGSGQELGPRHASRSVTAIMITTSDSSVKRSGTPNQFLGVLLHTMAMSGLSRRANRT
jgi:hypothetical protein